MKIAVLGAGAMGSLFGARLALAGQSVQLIDVNAEHIKAVRSNGLRLEADDGDHRVTVPIAPAHEVVEPTDLLIVFTKGPHTEAALGSVKHLVGPNTWGLTLQNGLGAGERLAQLVPAARVLIGMTNWPADVRGPGHVHTHGQGEVRLWSLDGADSQTLREVAGVLGQAGLNVTPDPQTTVAIWEKAAFNAAMNSIAAITGFSVGQMADDPDIPSIAAAVVAETVAVAQALDIDVSHERIGQAIAHAYAEHRPHKPSMLQDMLAGRPTEIEAINGAIFAHAQRCGVAAPTVEALLRLVRAKARQERL